MKAVHARFRGYMEAEKNVTTGVLASDVPTEVTDPYQKLDSWLAHYDHLTRQVLSAEWETVPVTFIDWYPTAVKTEGLILDVPYVNVRSTLWNGYYNTVERVIAEVERYVCRRTNDAFYGPENIHLLDDVIKWLPVTVHFDVALDESQVQGLVAAGLVPDKDSPRQRFTGLWCTDTVDTLRPVVDKIDQITVYGVCVWAFCS